MNKNKIIYWTSTGIITAMMSFSAFMYLTDPKMAESFTHLGFPSYFRIELGIAKLIGALVLILPQIPARIKEWAYAGFGFTFFSAIIAHGASGDDLSNIITPVIFLLILIASYVSYSRLSLGGQVEAI